MDLSYLASEKGFGFKIIGGNVVGLFVSEVTTGKKELQVGDQILEIAGRNAVQMSCFEASEIISKAGDKLQLKVVQNAASKFCLLKQEHCQCLFNFQSINLFVNNLNTSHSIYVATLSYHHLTPRR